MDLGVRHIRTAGKGGGGIELTLPADLRDLIGLPCRVTLRDGGRPDIVVRPDFTRARAAFAALWREMAAALLRIEGATLPRAEFSYGLWPGDGTGEASFLCWRDGLLLAAAAPHDPAAVARTLAAFGRAMAPALRISIALAAGFGAACGYLAAGDVVAEDWRDACDLAAAELADFGRPGAALAAADDEGVLGARFWRHAAPLLIATAAVFQDWTDNPSGHARRHAIALSGG